MPPEPLAAPVGAGLRGPPRGAPRPRLRGPSPKQLRTRTAGTDEFRITGTSESGDEHPERRSLQCPSVNLPRSAPRSGSTCSPPTPTRAGPSTASSWAGPSTEPNEDFGGYFNFTKDGSLVAGGMKNDGTAGVPDCWNVYLAVETPRRRVAAATAHGGGVIVPAMAVADMGSMAVITDAGGAAIGMWQPGTHKGMGVDRRARRPGLVRAPHPRLRRLGAVLQGRLRLGRQDHERHRRVPLHDPRRG